MCTLQKTPKRDNFMKDIFLKTTAPYEVKSDRHRIHFSVCADTKETY